MLADTGIGSPVSHRASTVGLIHHIPTNSGTATVRYADSIPQWRGPVRACSGVNFPMAQYKFEVKSVDAMVIDGETTATDAVALLPSHCLRNS